MAGKKKPAGPAPHELDWSEVERVLKLMAKHGLEEFEYSDGELHVRLKKATANRAATPAEAAAPETANASTPAPAAPAGSTELAGGAPGENLHIVKSPIVGTFYSAPNPNAPAFVKVGDRIGVGQVLCIIEAMKLMNEIESEIAGEIARVLIENGQPVEYGEPLFAIRPAGPARTA